MACYLLTYSSLSYFFYKSYSLCFLGLMVLTSEFPADLTRRACSVAQSCPVLCDPMDCSPPGSTVRGLSQARILEWAAISSSRGSSPPRDGTQVSCIAGRFFTSWVTREACVHSEHLLSCSLALGLCEVSLRLEMQVDSFRKCLQDFPAVQGLRLRTPNAGGPGLTPGQGTRAPAHT